MIIALYFLFLVPPILNCSHLYAQDISTVAERFEQGAAVAGGELTPEALGEIKKSPAFKDLKHEEIIQGRALLRKEERSGAGKVKEGKAAPAVTVEEERGEPLFDRYLSDVSPLEVNTELTPFGYEIFKRGDLTPPQDLPVASDYTIGPGDEVHLLLWGRVNERYTLTVSRDGTILLPQIGPLSVAGMSFEEMKEFLSREAKSIVGTEVSVTMGRLRSIQVFVLGEVRGPGAYTVNAMSTITNALIAAGGPTQIGSLRSVELKRSNNTIARMDFYDLLMKGDKSNDLRLRNGDVIFVPIVGPIVGIAGNVKRPAIYELQGEVSLSRVLDLAGGIIPTAYLQQVQVERVEGNEERVVVDIDAGDEKIAETFMVQDADMVKVFSILGVDVNAVYLYGNVKRPGKYELKEGMRLGDIVRDATDLLEESYFEYGLIKRLVPPSLEVKLIPFNLGDLLFLDAEADNVELMPLDSIYIFSKWLFQAKPTVSIEGEVRKKGTFDLEGNLTVKDLVLQAEGLAKGASYGEYELYRTEPVTKEVTLRTFSLKGAMEEDQEHNIILQDMDRVVVHSVWERVPKQVVTISGDVHRPGEYIYAANMTVKDLIFAAGNLIESAYLDEAELASFDVEGGTSSFMNYRTIELRGALSGDPAHNVALKPYDRLMIKRIPEWREERFVEMSGEVKFPGSYVVKKGERLSSLIERAGGYNDNAYLRGSLFARERVKELQQRGLDDMIKRLERDLLLSSATQVSSALSLEEVEARKVEVEQRQKFIESLRELKATGRMVIRLAHLRLLKGGEYDIELEDGDTLFIPMRNNVVNVTGVVMSPGSHVYSEKLDYKQYISLAGGFSHFADEDNIFVIKADGSARKLSRGAFNWDSTRSRWEVSAFGEKSGEIEPGDTIVVPEKLEHIAWLREIKDITQILMQIAVTAGVAVNLF